MSTALLVALAVFGCATGKRSEQPRFVTSAACASCHAAEFGAWTGSQHERAMQAATDSTVLGEFGDATFTRFGVTSRFLKRDGRFVVNTEGADGRMADFEVRYTFGVEPLQQYLVATTGGRLQALSIAWDTRRGRWFHLYPDERIAPGDPLHWTGPYLNWNAQCATCHSTRLKKAYDATTDTYATTWTELSVGCEACHGAGDRHVAWAGRKGGRRGHDPGFASPLPATNGRREVETCAPCHARRQQITDPAEPGDPFFDDFVPADLEEHLYFVDGQIHDEVYVYGSFAQSRMYAAGVRCSDCHDPHSLHLRAEGNALCTRCHSEAPDPRFPMLEARRYDSSEHHFHTPGTPGARCVDCHMPMRTYMVVDPRRDHGFKVPRPDLTASLGTPDACSACHHESPPWAAREIRGRRGAPPAREPFAPTIAAGRRRAPGVRPKLARLAADTTQPAIVRATALDLLGAPGWPAAPAGGAEAAVERALEAALRDEAPQVRIAAARSMELADPQERIAALAPLLDDPLRAVRIAAARALASVPRSILDEPTARAFDRALAECVASLEMARDTPAGNLNLALLREAQGRDDLAEAPYRVALRQDPTFRPARFNLAHLYNRTQRNADAERVLRAGLGLTPDDGELHYSLGLLLAEGDRYADSAVELGKAAALLPDRARVALNHGLALQRIGRLSDAQQELRRALQLDPNDAGVAAALAALESRRAR